MKRSSTLFASIVVVLSVAAVSGDLRAAAGVCDTANNVDVESSGGTASAGYATLQAALAAINVGTHTGTIVVEICGDTTETGTAVLNASGGSASYTTVLIQPVGGLPRTISGSLALPLVSLNGADGVTVDGLNADGNALTISNANSGTTAGTSTVQFINGATGNVVTNTTVLGSFSGTLTGANGGAIYFATDASTASGNDTNTISNCNIGPAGANLPTRAINGAGTITTAAIGNNGIIINNNNIFDYFAAATASSGIYVAGGNSGWSITNNRFYQTGTRTWTTGANNRAIDINNSTSTTGAQACTITGNTIGFSSSTGTGTYALTGSTGKFAGIAFSGLTLGTASSISSNTIAAVSLTGVTTSGTSTSSPLMAIFVNNGVANTNSNTIGSQSATGSLTYSTNTTSTSDIYGIYNFSVDAWTANGNDIGGITASNASTGSVVIYGLRANTTSSVAFNAGSNNVGGTVANSIQNNATGTASQVIGIASSLPVGNFTSNTVRNLTAAGGTGTGSGASLIGILNTGTSSTGHLIAQNTIHTLSNTHASAAVVANGIQYTGITSGTNTIARNFIHSLSVASTSGSAVINGINITGGLSTYQNNMIRLGLDAAGASIGQSTLSIVGIADASAQPTKLYHNSVWIGGSASSGAGSATTFAFRRTSSPSSATDLRDNALVNLRSIAAGTGKSYGIGINATTQFTSNFNVVYFTGTGTFFGLVGAADQGSLLLWQGATGQDASSIVADPQFKVPAGTSATVDLHIADPPTPTPVEGAGTLIAAVADDFDGQTRASFTPVDIGADAGNFTSVDLSPPAISYTAFANTTLLTDRPLSATITDNVAVASAGFVPRIYYKKNAGGYVSQACAGSYTCTIVVADVGGVTLGDVISYFVIAQDTSGNISSNPGGAVASDVNNVSSPPATPNSYTIVTGISGTKTVCASGCTYPTLTAVGGAFYQINGLVLTGNLNLEIAGDLTAGETGVVALNALTEEPAGSNFTLKIYPTGSLGPDALPRQITSTTAPAGGFIRLNGADRVTIDGSLGGVGTDRSLTITDTNTGTTSAVVWLQNNGADGPTDNTIKNCNIVGNSSTTTLIGIGSGGNGTTSVSTASLGNGNNNNTFRNNNINKVQIGIFSQGASVAVKNSGNLITQNRINTAAPNNATKGMLVGFENSITISENTITGLSGSTGYSWGISLGLTATTTTTTTGNEVTNALVSRNTIGSIRAASTFGVGGIQVASATSGTTQISNNAIYDVNTNPTFGDIAAGIFVGGGTGSTTQIFFNSVTMNAITALTGGAYSSFAVAINGSNPTIDMRDNVLLCTGSTGANLNRALGLGYATFTGLTSNFNDLRAGGTGAATVQTVTLSNTGFTTYLTLGDWQTAQSKDGSSISADPLFNSDTNLQPQPGSPVLDAGTSLSGSVSPYVDILGVTRVNPPSMGAYEAGADLTGPVITYTPLGNTTSLANRPLPTTVTDVSGVPTLGSGLPRVYIRKGTSDPFVGSACTFSGGLYNCTLRYSLVSGGSVAPGDLIQYYVVAQDNAVPPNVSANPSAGTGGFTSNPPAAATPPTTPASYLIANAVTGTKTVCASGCDYTTLTGATGVFNAINTGVATGNITIQIAGNLSTGEDGSVALNPLTEEPAGSNFTVKLYPTGSARTITSTTAPSGGFIRLNAADRVTIDGSLGGTGTDRSLTIVDSNTGTASAVVWLQSNGADGAQNNTVKNCVIVGNAPTTTLIGIGAGSSTVGTASLGTANNNNTFQNNSVTKVQFGIYTQGASAAAKNSGNVIQSNSLDSASPNHIKRAGVLVGFENGIQITDNSISEMASASSSEDTFGISLGSTSVTTSTLTGNEVTNALVARNNIGNVRQTATYSAIGIYVAPATTGTTQISNNSIWGVSANATSGDFTGGIVLGGGTGSTTQVYFNSVSLSGTQSGGSDKSFGLAIGGSNPTVNVRDNVFYNVQSNGTGTNYAIALNYTTTFTGLTANYNDYFVAAGATYSIGGTGSLSTPTNQLTLGDWITATGKDTPNSFSANPLFNSLSDLGPQTGSPLADAGVSLSGSVTPYVDILGLPRIDPPSIGAYENAGDTVGPVITYTPLGNTTSLANPTLTIGVTDLSGVPTGGIGLPQLYFRKGTSGGYAGSQCTFTSGSSYDCLIDYSSVGGVAPGDTIQYYVAAQDTLDNVSVKPSSGASGLLPNPPRATVPPTTPSSYAISIVFSGGYDVGSGGDFPSLTNPGGIFEALNNGVLSSDVTIDIISDLTGESGSVALNQLAEQGAGNWHVLLRPFGVPRTITGTGTGSVLIKLNGADRVTIDGSLSGGSDRSLTLSNPSTASGSVVVWIGSIGTGAGAVNDTVKNCIIRGGAIGNSTLLTFGVFAGDTTGAANGSDNDNLTVQNNKVHKVTIGIQAYGGTVGLNDNLLVADNTVGDAVDADSIGRFGISVGQSTGASITRNSVSNVWTSENVITSSNNATGIILGTGLVSSSATRNSVTNIRYTGSEGYGAKGIDVNTGLASSNLTVANNMVSDIKGDGWSSLTGDAIVGLRVNGSTGGVKLYHNSVNLGSGTFLGNIDGTASAAFFAGPSTTALDVRDNILATNIDNSAATDKTYAIATTATSNSIFTFVDYNDYSISGAAAFVGLLNGTDYATLATWKVASGQDLNSISANPLFTTATNLHLDTSGGPSPAENAGIGIPAVPTDYDGEPRNPSTPEIGADEVDACAGVVCSGMTDCGIAVCDPNGVSGNCAGFTPKPSGTECRADAGECDVAEYCDGVNTGACPTDAYEPGGTTCGDPTDAACDGADTCNGFGLCGDNLEPPTTVCRADAGDCDVAEFCDGAGSCPADAYEPSGTSCGDPGDTTCDDPDTCDGAGFCEGNPEPVTTECRADAGECDVAEFCDGAGACPADGYEPSGTTCGDPSDTTCDDPDTCDGAGLCDSRFEPVDTECRAEAGDCDVAEFCDGAGACPADAYEPSGTACGDPGDTTCDDPDTCDGGGSCESNFEPATTECRPDIGDCDLAELCDGAGACPADLFEPSGTSCGDPSDTDCDNPDTCSGASAACLGNYEPPTALCGDSEAECVFQDYCDGGGLCADSGFKPVTTPCGDAEAECVYPDYCDGDGVCADNGFKPADTECRAAVGNCDYAELCPGTSGICPADAVVPDGTECRGVSGDCDLAESCDGSSGLCPADEVVASGAECRAADGDCDTAESCDGANPGCPVDGFLPETTECRPSSGNECDPAEFCTGANAECPPDSINTSSPVGFSVRLAETAGCDCCSADPDEEPGCNDATCESAVCATDPYCCSVMWDSVCAEESAELCTCCSETTVDWGLETMPGPFNVYHGSFGPGAGWTYDQICMAAGVGGTSVTDPATPAPHTLAYYLVTRVTPPCDESSLGLDSQSNERPNTYPCGTPPPDADLDGWPDPFDNCPTVANAGQSDVDQDSHGDVCDNCPTRENPDQSNIDGDSRGDLCDADIDGDGVLNGADNCPTAPNPNQYNLDADAYGDCCDPDFIGPCTP